MPCCPLLRVAEECSSWRSHGDADWCRAQMYVRQEVGVRLLLLRGAQVYGEGATAAETAAARERICRDFYGCAAKTKAALWKEAVRACERGHALLRPTRQCEFGSTSKHSHALSTLPSASCRCRRSAASTRSRKARAWR